MPEETAISRRGPARAEQRARTVLAPRRRGQPHQKTYDPTPDERGLTPWHYLHGRQIICGTCNQRPCAASCPEQWMPDRPEWKAARAGQACGERRAALGGPAEVQAPAGPEDRAANAQRLAPTGERRIPVEAALAQAMAVVAGEARAEDVRPVYEALD